jgi:anti-sigma regulatory factor (Ser/Thr protein kinase)
VNASAGVDVLELSLPADPALALTARMFAGALAEHLPDVNPDDLKLALSELLAAGVDAGADVVEFRADLGRTEVVVRGAGTVDADETSATDELERFAHAHRADLLTALFPRLRTEHDMVVLPLGPQE